ESTQHLIGERELALMPRGAYLVNVARGPLVDLDALLAALERGQLAAAALDVLPVEPPTAELPPPQHPHLVVTPHAACSSPATETVRRIIRDAIVDGRIPPGDQLRESRLVDMLGTSRGTVREALRLLVQEGLVEYRMHHGAFVQSPKLAGQLDVYVAREAIEV